MDLTLYCTPLSLALRQEDKIHRELLVQPILNSRQNLVRRL